MENSSADDEKEAEKLGATEMSLDRLEALEGKTIKIARKTKLADVRLLQIGFTDGTECAIVADNPTIDVNLVDDSEHIIPAIER